MDFDRKSGNNSGAASNERDPLLELTRLFGGKPEGETADADAEHDNETVAEFPSGEFPALNVAYSSQGNFNEYLSYASSLPGEDGEPCFLEEVNGEEYEGYPLEEDFQTRGYYEAAVGGGEAASFQDSDFSVYYHGDGAQEVSAAGNHEAANAHDRCDEREYDTEPGWHNADYPYDDANRPAGEEETAYSSVSYETQAQYEAHTQWPRPAEQVRPHGLMSYAESGQREDWRQREAAWEHGAVENQSSARADDRRGGFHRLPDAFFKSEDALPYAEENVDFSAEDTVDPAGQAVYDVAHVGYYPEEAQAGVPEMQNTVQSPENGFFDSGFFNADIPQEAAFDPSDYRATHGEQVAYPEDHGHIEENAAFSRYDEGEAPFYNGEENSVFPEEAVDYETDPQWQADAVYSRSDGGQTQTYFNQAGNNYNYTIQPVMQPIGCNQSADRENFSYQGSMPEEEDTAAQNDYLADEVAFGRHHNHEAQAGVSPHQRVAQTRQDFDRADHPVGRGEHEQAPEMGTLGLNEERIEETDVFDLPPVGYETEAAYPLNDVFDQEFSDIFQVDAQSADMEARDGTAPEEQFFSTPEYMARSRRNRPPEELENDRESDHENAVYDWAAPAALAAAELHNDERELRGGKHRWLYGLFALAAFIVLGSGVYILFFPMGESNRKPAIIHAEQGEIKVKPQNTGQSLTDHQDQAVYNRVEGNTSSAVEQQKLIDKTETPVEIHRIEEQPPAATESGLNQSSVENFVKTAAARSMPIHVVPTVVVSPDRKVVAISDPGQKETVLVPGGASAAHTNTAHADMHNAVAANSDGQQKMAAETAMPAKQQDPVPQVNDIREPDRPAQMEKQFEAVSSDITDAAKNIIPPTVIPAKPEPPVQVAAKTTEKARLRQEEMARAVGEDSGVMAPNDFYMQISSQQKRRSIPPKKQDGVLAVLSAIIIL